MGTFRTNSKELNFSRTKKNTYDFFVTAYFTNETNCYYKMFGIKSLFKKVFAYLFVTVSVMCNEQVRLEHNHIGL